MIVYEVITIGIIFIQGVLVCEPSEEGKPFVMKAQWTLDVTSNIEVSWRKDGIPKGTCILNKECTMYLPHLYKANVRAVSEKIVVATLSILNVSKSDEGLWALEAVGLKTLDKPDIFHCSLKVREDVQLVLENCPAEIFAGTEIVCVCNVSTPQKYPILWYNGQSVVQSQLSNVLSFIAQEKNQATYSCRLNASETPYILYAPNIKSRYRLQMYHFKYTCKGM